MFQRYLLTYISYPASSYHLVGFSHIHCPPNPMKAYYYDNVEGNMTAPHNSGRQVDLETLEKAGLIYKHCPSIDVVNEIAEQRHYKNRDIVKLNKDTFQGGERALWSQLEKFFHEHLHEDEEIRYVLGGEGYFDVRSKDDEWVRILVQVGELLILPPGIYHRFTLTEKMDIQALRLFKDEPKWTAIPRGENAGDLSLKREEYLSFLKV